MERTILHCDLNNFYASVECLYRPELSGRPVAVCGDPERRHGIVLAKNQLAKGFGVQTGEAIWQARQKCPGLVLVPPHYKRYLVYSKLAREIYLDYTDQVESFGLDECWLDVTGSRRLFGSGVEIADQLRSRIRDELGVTASVGISFNKIFAKLGSDLKKPDASTWISQKNFPETVWPLPSRELLYVGRSTQQTLKRWGLLTIGDMAKARPSFLKRILGKNGLTLWSFANGLDQSPVAPSHAVPLVKSVGNNLTAHRDLIRLEDVKITLYLLCESVAERLREQKLACGCVQLSVRGTDLRAWTRQRSLPHPTDTARTIFETGLALYAQNVPSNTPVRSLGIRAERLTADENRQLSFLPLAEEERKQANLERSVDQIRRRFGHFSIERGLMLKDRELSALDVKGEHIIHPESFFHPYDRQEDLPWN